MGQGGAGEVERASGASDLEMMEEQLVVVVVVVVRSQDVAVASSPSTEAAAAESPARAWMGTSGPDVGEGVDGDVRA
ncbi:unnamed protein product [Miscanthus lutarioriparius]|uniref:Uncharacterized protein n=1 Tax=Miscanthus lutarioriparius TaxID=422564 RepID=A0A811N050_9POAL|nr:unnamed protein product [Miscanthus lutarioriparius]